MSDGAKETALKVVTLDRSDETVIKAAEHLLELVKKGDVVSFVCATQHADGCIGTQMAIGKQADTFRLIGAASHLVHKLHNRVGST